MSDQNIFSNGVTPTGGTDNGGGATPPNGQSAQPFADLLGSIKNERGEPKYKDVQTALEALRHSQEYIPTLKQEKEANDAKLAALAAEVERLKNIEQTVAQLTQQQQPQQQQPAPVGVTEDVVATLVNQTLTQREQAAKKAANVNSVVTALTQKLGGEADKEFYKKAEELGMTAEQMNNLAAQSPTAVLKLFGLEGNKVQTSSSLPVQSSVNTAGLQPQQHSYIGRNETTANVGATTQELMAEAANSKQLVEELHKQGLSTYDLTDPKIYKKYFSKNKG